MFQYDFSNHQNRFIALDDMPQSYRTRIEHSAQSDPFYPRWHIAPPCGLLNDPCGLFEQDGEHHLFHQWFPAGPVHGLKYWRHVKTRDFVHYTVCGAPLAPCLPFDDHGCYTGCAYREPAGDVSLYYTGIAGEEMEPTVCRGTYQGGTVANRHVVVERDDAQSAIDFRDPCLFDRDGARYMLVGSQSLQGKGQLLMYRGEDADRFVPCGALALDVADARSQDLGYMIECPNYYEDNGSAVLFFAPMGLQSTSKYDYKNVFSVVYAVGDPIDVTAGAFHAEHMREMDKGFDFYAPQCYADESGRRILIGWLGNSKSEYPTDASNWAHMLTVPREITVEGDCLVQRPVVEIAALRGERHLLEDMGDAGATVPLDPQAPSADIDAWYRGDFSIEISNDQGDTVRFIATDNEYCLDRSAMTHLYAERFGTVRYARRLCREGRLRVLVDTSSIEIFADNGKTVFTSRYFIDRPTRLVTKGVAGSWYRLEAIELSGQEA